MTPTAAQSPSIAATKKKAALLAICLGGLGVHKFYLGYKKAGTIMLVIGLLGWFPLLIPTLAIALVGLIEGIIYLSKSDEDFANTYLAHKREWF
jgi:TM2 domain-containing membrane protein YozV